jgi:hypothetical protein
MSREIKPVLVTRQEIVILLRPELRVAEHVHVTIRVRYNEPKLN